VRFNEVVLFVQIVHRGPEGVCWRSILLQCPPVMMTRAGSSTRLVRLKPQGLGPERGPDRPV